MPAKKRHTETVTIAKRWPRLSAISVEITCAPDATIGVKLGLAVREAYKTGADLTGADLTGADLTSAVLRGAVLRGAVLTGADLTGAVLRGAVLRGEKITHIFALAGRLDGYTFYGVVLAAGGWKIAAGCRWFTAVQFREHVAEAYPSTPKADETLALIDYLEGRARYLGVETAQAVEAA